ncbi:Helicase required for RNAi-mediated heterochromatin assembly 1 [Diplonema papillatum]|nr:Helicase required for RNAi-mediated heterochromatin assembly 1 [Diplonema papillatum]KAJ9473555.1 Helicase required for RNAi-mediated heterochromatin assembly 1 [Diplonema papillatum]
MPRGGGRGVGRHAPTERGRGQARATSGSDGTVDDGGKNHDNHGGATYGRGSGRGGLANDAGGHKTFVVKKGDCKGDHKGGQLDRNWSDGPVDDGGRKGSGGAKNQRGSGVNAADGHKTFVEKTGDCKGDRKGGHIDRSWSAGPSSGSGKGGHYKGAKDRYTDEVGRGCGKGGKAGGKYSGEKGGKSTFSGSARDKARFVRCLKRAPDFQVVAKDVEDWAGLWGVSNEWDLDNLKLLFKSFARLPASETVFPPPIEECATVITRFLSLVSMSENEKLKDVDLVLSVVDRLCAFTWEPAEKETVTASLTNILAGDAISWCLDKRQAESRHLNKKVDAMLDKLEKDSTIKVALRSEPESGDSSRQWLTPEVRWLQVPAYFSPQLLPVMRADGVYNSSESYLKIVHELWIAMAFSDAHAAVAPKCRVEIKGDKQCQNPLCPQQEEGRCRTRGCTARLAHACPRHRSEGLCSDHYRSAQSDLLGPAGPKAFTHTYNAIVARTTDDSVHLQSVASRNPPTKFQINWKTTGRLACPNLVAIIKLPCFDSRIKPSDRIHWGELKQHPVPKTDGRFAANQEWRKRENGQVLVNMMSINPRYDHECFEPGQPVAVIDCMTFVPEWVPVLKALEQLLQDGLPFDDGRWLNLCRDSPVVQADTPEIEDCSTTADLVDELLATSQLDPIADIRNLGGHSGKGKLLAQQLTQLLEDATLDDMQLVSFLESLSNMVHLTQGPPGTGKSYLGVVLVRALLLIRKAWASVKSVAVGPILVLSYKNHAIDEFLMDLVTQERPIQLVRIGGGKQVDPKLSRFTEFAARDTDDVKGAQESVKACANERSSWKDSRHRASELHDLLGEVADNPENGRKIAESVDMLTTLLNTHPDDGSATFQTSVSVLLSEAQHYRVDQKAVLTHFISGGILIPPCSANGCQALAVDESHTCCNDHRCFSDDQPCLEQRAEGKIFCDDHACSICEYPRAPSQLYCVDHSCCVCIESKLLAKEATDEPPRNVCEDHPMCCKCNAQCLSGTDYCADHQQVACRGRTRKGKPCKGQGISVRDPFCPEHAKSVSLQLKGPSARDPLLVPGVCVGLTTKGRPCKSFVAKDSRFCRDHAQQALDSTTQAPVPECKTDPPDQSPPNGSDSVPQVDAPKPDDASPSCEDGAQNTRQPSVASSGCDDAHEPDTCFFGDNQDEVIIDDIEDEPETMAHLKDVHEVSDNSSVASSQSEDNLAFTRDELPYIQPLKWSFGMSKEDRWKAVFGFIREHERVVAEKLETLQKETMRAREELRLARVRARMKSYEGKAIVGGTIVGCITRLEAIRALNPFAIVIEEASEVLEPLLLSCLCSSTCKLEMIGDHRQLKPSIMQKFTFEQINKVNRSMFERLILAPSAHRVPSSILSTQRRMRKNICDFTRGHYHDLTEIEDHAICSAQVLGERDGLSKRLTREVPGIRPHVFLWTHDGAQGKARVGLSRVNRHEASLVCSLVRYLVSCGVPHRCIVVLTPYKGQFRELREELKKSRHWDPDSPNRSVRLSTVDRFQGDESDIVVASLVVDKNSSTPFVKLVNRMVVLLSRARLAMYLVANIGYFDRASEDKDLRHWADALAKFRSRGCEDSDTGSPPFSEMGMAAPRTGPTLPLTCPSHPEVVYQAELPEDLELGKVCDRLCNSPLSCTHQCPLPCHWWSSACVKECRVKVPSPCLRHALHLECSKVFAFSTARDGDSIAVALDNFACPERVVAHWPCTHETEVACSYEQELVKGLTPWPQCKKPALQKFNLPCTHSLECKCWEYHSYTNDPLTIPECNARALKPFKLLCGHELQCLCHEYHEYCKSPALAPPCLKESPTMYRLPCGHDIKCKCFEYLKYTSSPSSAPICRLPSKSPFPLPCKHLLKCKCYEFQKYESAPHTVPPCSAVVTFTPPCGHSRPSACWERQKYEKSPSFTPLCETPTEYTRPCGHILKCKCFEHDRYNTGSHSAPSCKVVVMFTPSCGHNMKLPCHDEREYKTGRKYLCPVQVDVVLPRCGHDAKVPCAVATKLKEWNGVRVEQRGSVVVGRSYGPEDFVCDIPVIVELPCGHKINRPCNAAFEVAAGRIPRCIEKAPGTNPFCGHTCSIACSTQESPDFKKLRAEELPLVKEWTASTLPAKPPILNSITCAAEVRLKLPCGHHTDVTCDRAASRSLSPCCVSVSVENPICGHSVGVSCHKATLLAESRWSPLGTKELEDRRVHGIIAESAVRDMRTPSQFEVFKSNCSASLNCKLLCGHEIMRPCAEICRGVRVECEQTVGAKLRCGHERLMRCNEKLAYTKGAREIRCEELVARPCWNNVSCGNDVGVPCCSSVTPGCEQELGEPHPSEDARQQKPGWWKCDTSLHNLPHHTCSEGTPSHCPHCFTELLERHATTSPPLSDLSDFPDDLQKVVRYTGEMTVLLKQAEKQKFANAETRVLDQMLSTFGEKDVWQRPVYDGQRVVFFVERRRRVRGKRSGKALNFIDPRRMVAEHAHGGILVHELTAQNLRQLPAGTEILVGVAARILMEDVAEFPTKEELKALLEKGCLAVRTPHSSRETNPHIRLTSLIYFDPFPLVATHSTKISDSLIRLLDPMIRDGVMRLVDAVTPKCPLLPRIVFRKPKNLVTFAPLPHRDVSDASANDSQASSNEAPVSKSR